MNHPHLTLNEVAMVREALKAHARELHKLGNAQRSWQTDKYVELARETRERAQAFLELAEKFGAAS